MSVERAEGIEGMEPSPVTESSFAVEHGFVGSAPDVVIMGAAVRRAREAAGVTADDIAAEMTRREFSTNAATIADLEQRSACRMRPRPARLLAAIIDLPLEAIEASAEPWPADEAGLAVVRSSGADVLVLGDHVVVRSDAGDYLGVLGCSGAAATLDSRTYRTAAAKLLNGPWSHLAGVLLVSREPPHEALPVDALDCVARPHAPSGVSGFSRLASPAPLADALAAYDHAYSISWTDPPGIAASAVETAPKNMNMSNFSEQCREEGRRARQPGKKAGYTRAARWLGRCEGNDIRELLDELADLEPDEAEVRLREVVGRARAAESGTTQ